MFEAILGGATKLIGGLLGKSSQDKANEIAQQQAAQNIQLQKDFAQNAISWKVADAQRAGVHPLYALGASTTSFSPVSVGVSGADPLASALGDMGQDVSRAAGALRGAPERQTAAGAVAAGQELKANALKLENMELQNTLLRSRILNSQQPGTPPGVAVPIEEDPKVEKNPPLMIGGNRVSADPDWSPTKAVSDRWGDESLATNAYGNVRAARDLFRTFVGSQGDWWSNIPNTSSFPIRAWLQMRRAVEQYRQQPLPVRPSYRPYRH